MRQRYRVVVVSAALILACQGVEPPDPPTIHSLTYISGSGQTGAAGSELTDRLVTRVVDAAGQAVPGAVVQWEIMEGEGDLSAPRDTSDDAGYADVAWTLGTRAGTARAGASLSGSSEPHLEFTAAIVAGPPHRIEPVTVPEAGRVNSVQQVIARVSDTLGNPVANVVVRWSASRGTLITRDTSAIDGLIETSWQLDSLPGVDIVSATVVDPDRYIAADFQIITTSRRWTHPEVLWSWSSPAIGADGTIYYGTRNGQLRAVNPDGSLRWKYVLGGSGEGVEEGPTVGPDGRIYVGSYPGILFHAVTPQGTQAWTFPVTNSVRSTPAIGADGTVYALGSGDSLYALTSAGSRKWTVPVPDADGDSPVIGGDGTIYVPEASAGRLHAIAPNGSTKWVHTFPGPSINNDLGTPSIDQDGTIYITAQDQKLHALHPDGNEGWAVLLGATEPISAAPRAAPAIGSDGTIYVGSFGGGIYALTRAGAVLWNTSDFTPGIVFGTPVLRNDGSIVYADTGGGLYCVAADGTLLWVDRVMHGGGLGSPAIAPDGTIYLTSGAEGLVAFDGGVPPAAAPWPTYMHDQFHTGRQQ